MRELIVYHTDEQLEKVKEWYKRIYDADTRKTYMGSELEIKSPTGYVIANVMKDSSITESYRGNRFSEIYFMDGTKVDKYIYDCILEPSTTPKFYVMDIEMYSCTRSLHRRENIFK